MKSFKSILIISVLSVFTLAGCGNNSNKQVSSSSASHHSNVKQSSSQSSSSSSSSDSSNSKTSSSSSSKKSSSTQNVQIDNKTAGVLAWKLVNYRYFAEEIKERMYYGTNSQNKDANGYDFITANGDITSNLFYKVNGNQLTYKTWVQTGQATMDGHYKTATVSLQSLVDKFYATSSQQSKTKADVAGLVPYPDHAE